MHKSIPFNAVQFNSINPVYMLFDELSLLNDIQRTVAEFCVRYELRNTISTIDCFNLGFRMTTYLTENSAIGYIKKRYQKWID